MPTVADDRRPICLLLLPRPLEHFILRETATDLMRTPGVTAVAPPRGGYGSQLRLPPLAAGALARAFAHVLLTRHARRNERIAAVVIFHPVQVPVALALIGATTAELWYGRWDRYERAYDANAARRARIERLHRLASSRATLTFAASDELARIERESDNATEIHVTALSADAFPAPDPTKTVVAVSLGHLGHRTDWSLLRQVGQLLGERLVLLLIGERHDNECADDGDFHWCKEHPSFVWLGAQSDAQASRLILCADVGIVPFERSEFNDAGLPYRILKYARLGRRTVTPPLAGARTWQRAITVADTAASFAAALVAESGRRGRPDLELRAWALAQTAETQNAPLHTRLAKLKIGTDAPRA